MAALKLTLPDDASHGGADEVLSQNERTRVLRRRVHGGPSLILKQGFSSDSLRRLRHEAAMLQRLAGTEGVPRLLAVEAPAPDVLTFHDDGGVSLAQVLREERLGVAEVLRVGLGLARVLAAVHRQGVVHRDLNPANIVLVGVQRRPVLIDFDIASSFAEEAPSFTHQSEITGTLTYMAPEQTGRTGRTIDQRADLYSLGATLYEMLTGRPPFNGQDPLQLIHDHLVRTPVPPIEQLPEVPRLLSDLVMRLLEKESDRRYQSAEGLAHDLARLAEVPTARLADAHFVLGEHDFAARLSAPSRLIGREREIDALRDAFEASLHGRGSAVLVAGGPGVGKTSLINELRPMATARRGWFVSGKFDQSRRDTAASAILQALRALGRLLLSQPEEELAGLRLRLAQAIGPNAGLMVEVLPEFSVLLDASTPGGNADPLLAEARLFQAGVALLRTLASPERPVVMVIDDLQWAGAASVKFLDALMNDDSLRGLLLVGAYRPGEIDAAHPLTATLARWAQQPLAPARLQLDNLPPTDLGLLLQGMLRLPSAPAAELARAVGERTGGNPFDTVEFINALRHDGALRLTERGWQWEAEAIRRYIGRGEVVDLLGRRIERLPVASAALLSTIACLSGEMELVLLQAATGLDADEVDARIAAPLEDGLLIVERGGTSLPLLRFRHDRVQQAAYARLDETQRQAEHLALARRLLAAPAWATLAAEQYLIVAAVLDDPRECREVAALFRDVALRTMRVNYTLGERFLSAAITLLARVQAEGDQAELLLLRTHRVFTLYCLGQHDELDAAYAEIAAQCDDPLQLHEAAGLLISSLTARGRATEAAALGRALLQRLAPQDDSTKRSDDEAWQDLVRWAAQLDLQADLQRPEVTDPQVLAAINMLSRYAHAAYFCGPQVLSHALYESVRLWRLHGPAGGMMSGLSQAPVVTVGLHGDYRTGYALTRHALLVSQARGYEPQTAQIRGTMGIFAQHWFEPLENCLRNLAQSREQMLMGGSMTTASFAYNTTLALELECAPALDRLVVELEAADSLAKRVGNVLGMATVVAFRQLTRAMRGETDAAGSFDAADFSEVAHLAGPGAHPVPGAAYHNNRALTAAVFGDSAALARSAAAAMASGARQTAYRAASAHLWQGLALAQALQAGDDALQPEFDACCAWVSARAAEAPANYLYMQHWLQAEGAWARGEAWEATRLFNEALRDVARSRRPLHHALMLERCALQQLAGGMQEFAETLLLDALQAYRAWGASAKVEQLLAQHPFLQARQAAQHKLDGRRSTGVSSDQIDMLAILRASQALSSETDLVRLQSRVDQLLISLTGATRVTLVLRGDGADEWALQASPHDSGLGVPAATPVDEAQRRLPVSAFRYALRTREPLLVEDAVQDDRFAADPYLSGLERCSLLVVPIQSQGELRAVLLLENRQSRGAFSAHRLDAVNLIAGQLAVSLDNAMLYASLARKVAERTEELEQVNRRLEMLAITDALTGLANRRHFNEVLEAEWQRALRSGSSIGLAMIDVDQFKLYNDHYGHLGGDACLKRVASVLKEGQRVAADLSARYGGEEFALVLPNTDLAGTHAVAERLRGQVAALREPHAKSSLGFVTISVGIAAFVPSERTSIAHWIEVADAALYEAKRQGRNQVRDPS